MATEHKNIPDSGRHEPKGASTALNGQAIICNGDGTTTPKYVDYSTVINKPTYPGFTLALQAFSTAVSQLPPTTNTNLQVEFGALQAGTDVSISALGVITFNTAGQYLISRSLRFGRTVLAGQAFLFYRHSINGSPSGSSGSIVMDNNLDVVPVNSVFLITATAGQTLTTEIIRDSSGVNTGGLYSATPVASGWSVSPSASISVYKYRGAV